MKCADLMTNLQSTVFEEADFRITLHVLESVKEGHMYSMCGDLQWLRCHCYLAPPHACLCSTRHQRTVCESWCRRQYIPLHTMCQCLAALQSEVLPAVHSLTGCDITSKVGTKKAAQTAEPQKFLKNFGKLPQLSSSMTTRAEHYNMIKVSKPKSTAKTFTELRAEVFHHNKTSSLHNLNPTSEGILPHIKRSFYNTYILIQCLEIQLDMENTVVLNPEECRFVHDQDELIIKTSWKSLEPHWSVTCTCVKCAWSSFSFRIAGVKCGKCCDCM